METEMEKCYRVKDAVLTIDNFIKEKLYALHPKTVERWFETKTEIDRIIQREAGRSVYGVWE